MWLSFFLLGIVVVASKMADKEVKIPVVTSELECEEHCTSLTACRTWTFEENACAVTMSPHAFVAGSSDNRISLLQGGSCNIWEDPDCGMQVDTFVFGECSYGFDKPEHCMGYCSKGCEFVRGPCEASCQPVITFQFRIQVGNLCPPIPNSYEPSLRTELTALWGHADESFVEITPSTCSGSAQALAMIRVTITPFSNAFPTTALITSLSLAETTHLDFSSSRYLSRLDLFECIEGCVDHDPICETGVLNNEGDVCCPASCGTCGGTDCQTRPGGSAHCCPQDIRTPQDAHAMNLRSCNEFLPPCNIGTCFQLNSGHCSQNECLPFPVTVHVPEGTYNLRAKAAGESIWEWSSPIGKWGACINYQNMTSTAGYKSYSVFDWATESEAKNALPGAILGQVVVEQDSDLCWFCGDSTCADNAGTIEKQVFCLENTEFVCPTPNGLFAAATCGSYFYDCSNGVAHLNDCADGGDVTLCFDRDQQACDLCSNCETVSP